MKPTLGLLTTAVLLLTSSASAATRAYCFELLFKDDRLHCPTPAAPGARRACHQDFYSFPLHPDGDYTHPVGAIVEIWDKDDIGDDELIGTFRLANPNGGCAVFEWEGMSYQKGEADPDPYVVWTSKVGGASGGPRVVARDLSNNRYGGVSWRAFAQTNCTAGGSCDQPGYLLVTTDSTTERGGRVMTLDSAQHMLAVYTSVLEPGDIDMRWPAAATQELDQTAFEIAEAHAIRGQGPAHMLGHVLHMQQFDRDTLQKDCSLNGPGHALRVEEFESCATAEGWASYVAAVSLWDPQNNLSKPSLFGVDYADATPIEPVCSDNAGLTAQVAKAFWDLDDSDNEPGAAPSSIADEKDSDTLVIAQRWGVFLDGTDNREDQESDVDGVNLWDYHINSQSFWSNLEGTRHTLLGHNCMGTQDTN